MTNRQILQEIAPGFDLRRLSLASPEACRDACAAEVQCVAFTFVKNAVGDCFLKNNVPKPAPEERCVSGVKSGAARQ